MNQRQMQISVICQRCGSRTPHFNARTHEGGPTLQEFLGMHSPRPVTLETIKEMMDECICHFCGYPLKGAFVYATKSNAATDKGSIGIWVDMSDSPLDTQQGEDDG